MVDQQAVSVREELRVFDAVQGLLQFLFRHAELGDEILQLDTVLTVAPYRNI